MRTRFFLLSSVLGYQLITGLGCARAGMAHDLKDTRQEKISNEAEIPPVEIPDEQPAYTVHFGPIEIGGVNCNIDAGDTSMVDRDAIVIPDFNTTVNLKKSDELKRSSCNLSIPFETLGSTGYAITSIELVHERHLPRGGQFRLYGEVFITGQRGSKFEETLELEVSDKGEVVEHKEYLLDEPLVVCGKNRGLLRMNLSQIVEQHEKMINGYSKLRDLRIQYTPIECQ